MHDRDDDYPLPPDNLQINKNLISEKQHQLELKYYGAHKASSSKLICSFLDKTQYVIYLPLLLLYISRGIELKKLHRAVKFKAGNIL